MQGRIKESAYNEGYARLGAIALTVPGDAPFASTQVPAQCEPEGEAVLQIHFEGYLAASRSVRAVEGFNRPAEQSVSAFLVTSSVAAGISSANAVLHAVSVRCKAEISPVELGRELRD